VEFAGDSGAVPPLTPPPATAGSIVIDFDDLPPQPPLFNKTVAARDEYAALGVTFSGPNPLDGGAIVSNGGFGVIGYSPPNFLGFNCIAQLADGGIPTGPERLTFSSLVTFVQINVASGQGSQGQSLTIEAFNDNDELIDANSVVLQPLLVPLTVSGAGIRYVVIGQVQACAWVGDDLSFEMGTVSVESVSWGQLKTAYR
jgi:hypothetical protein